MKPATDEQIAKMETWLDKTHESPAWVSTLSHDDCRSLIGRIRADAVNMQIINAINTLRENEGSAVTIFCDNPDGSGPDNHAIEVFDDWTEWNESRFQGKTLIEALSKAIAKRDEIRRMEVTP